MHLFWQQGYEATSISDLTAAMGIGAPSLYAAFGDKKALFREVLEVYGLRYGGFIARALAQEPTARQAIARTLREAATEYTHDGLPHGCMVISAGADTTNLDVAALLRELRNSNVVAYQDRIQRDIDAGLLPPDTDAVGLARYIGAIIAGMSQSARDGASRAELAKVAELAMRAWPTP